MTKTQSLLNAAKLADVWADEVRSFYVDGICVVQLDALEAIADKMTRNYARADVSTWSDSAGTSISARVGDYHIVNFWDGEDILCIFQCSPDDEVSEVIAGDPLFYESL